MRYSLAQKNVVVTGASSGFGAAAAVAFACEGARLWLGARREDRLQRVAADALAAGSPGAVWRHLDVSSTTSVDSFFRWVGDTLPAARARIDVLANNAGGAHGLDTVAEGRDDDWEAMIQSNLLGLLRATRATLPFMRDNPGASIINIGSIAGHVAYEGGAVYCAVKASERQVSRALRLELCGTGIRVSSIDPGLAETEFSMVRFKGDAARAAKVYEGMTPLSAADVAEIMVWVASRPEHVNIDELLVKPTDQAAMHKIHRRPRQAGGPSS